MDFYMVVLLLISFGCVLALTTWCFKLVEEK